MRGRPSLAGGLVGVGRKATSFTGESIEIAARDCVADLTIDVSADAPERIERIVARRGMTLHQRKHTVARTSTIEIGMHELPMVPELASRIDHAVLKPNSSERDVVDACSIARRERIASDELAARSAARGRSL